jgi:hypothetical protein
LLEQTPREETGVSLGSETENLPAFLGLPQLPINDHFDKRYSERLNVFMSPHLKGYQANYYDVFPSHKGRSIKTIKQQKNSRFLMDISELATGQILSTKTSVDEFDNRNR